MDFLEEVRRRAILIIAIVITIILFLFSIGAYLYIPEFIDPLQNFGEELPALTKVIIYTYQYWIALPFISLITSVHIGITGEGVIKKRYHPLLFLISLLLIAVILIVLSVWGMYAPILALE